MIGQNYRGGLAVWLSRHCLMCAFDLTKFWVLACAAWLAIFYANIAMWGLLLLLAMWWFKPRRFRGSGWKYGSASLATPVELASAGMLGSTGILIGMCRCLTTCDAITVLRRPRGDPEIACRLFLRSLGKQKDGAWVRLNRGTHSVCFAGTGRGKGSGLVIPTLLTYDQAIICIDPKGENYRASAQYRKKRFGHQIVVIDPFHEVTDRPDTFNPLDLIGESDLALDDAKSVAESLVISTGNEKEPHWNASAALFIWVITAYVLHFPEDERNLQSVREILSNPKLLEEAQKRLTSLSSWHGMLASLGAQLEYFVDREKGSVLTTTNRMLHFLSTIPVAASTMSTSFNPARLRTGKMTCYLVLPTQHLRSQSSLLRLWINGLMRATIAGGANESGKTLWILDEAAALGHLDIIHDAVERMRGFGTRLFFFYQSMGQLNQCFPDGRAQTFLSNMDNQVYFGVNDVGTANAVSDRLGMATVAVRSESGGWNRGRSQGQTMSEQRSTGVNEGYNISETGRKLLFADEIMNLPERTAIVFTPGVKPFMTSLVRYYERGFRSVLERPSRFWLLIRSTLLLAFVMVIGVGTIGLIVKTTARSKKIGPVMMIPNEKGLNHGEGLRSGRPPEAKNWRRPPSGVR